MILDSRKDVNLFGGHAQEKIVFFKIFYMALGIKMEIVLD